MLPQLDTPELVQKAMLAGLIAPISMAQCAYVHGDKMVQAFLRWDELRGDIKTASDVLVDFRGKHVWEQAQNAVEHITWLKNELLISRYNESAAHAVVQQDQATLMATRAKLRYARIYLADVPNVPRWLLVDDSTQGDGHEQIARQKAGAASAK